MKIHYKHQQGTPRCTMAIADIPKQVLEASVILRQSQLLVAIGVTFVHPKDQYVKKTGREQAEKEMHKQYAHLKRVDFQHENNRTIYRFEIQMFHNRNLKFLEFGMSTNEGSENTHLEYAFVWDGV